MSQYPHSEAGCSLPGAQSLTTGSPGPLMKAVCILVCAHTYTHMDICTCTPLIHTTYTYNIHHSPPHAHTHPYADTLAHTRTGTHTYTPTHPMPVPHATYTHTYHTHKRTHVLLRAQPAGNWPEPRVESGLLVSVFSCVATSAALSLRDT